MGTKTPLSLYYIIAKKGLQVNVLRAFCVYKATFSLNLQEKFKAKLTNAIKCFFIGLNCMQNFET